MLQQVEVLSWEIFNTDIVDEYIIKWYILFNDISLNDIKYLVGKGKNMPRKDSIDLGELTDSAFYILCSVIEEKHGYLIMKTIEELTNGEVTIGPASLYTTLKKLLSAGLVELYDTGEQNKKIYKITDLGCKMLEKEIQRKKQMVAFAEHFLK